MRQTLVALFLGASFACGGGKSPSFSISLPASRNVQAGVPDALEVTAARLDGHTAALALSIAPNAQGIAGSGSIAAKAASGVLRIRVPAALAGGTYALSVEASDGTKKSTAALSLPVLGYPAGIDASTSYLLARWNARQSLVDWSRFRASGSEFLLARTVLDLDGDGIPDVVVAPGIANSTDGVPMRIYRGQDGASGVTWTDATSSMIAGAVPSLVHARKLVVGDYNGDGIRDVFICAHGYDGPPFPGTTNALLLSDGHGHWSAASQPWTGTVGYHHGCASGDIDGDGDADIFVTNSNDVSYFLVNDGHGNFTKDSSRLPASLSTRVPIFVAELFDLDGDGHLDLVTGGVDGSVNATVFWGDGTGFFSDARAAVVTGPQGWPNSLVFAAEDLDGDGVKELIIGRTKGLAGDPDFYKGYLVQVLKVSARQLTDVTDAWAAATNASAPAVIADANGPTWLDWFWVADQDGDGKPDLIGSSSWLGGFVARGNGASFSAWVKAP